MPDDHYDPIVIGSGPGGASLAHRTDAGFLPSTGVVNPTLTIIANARSVAHAIEQRMGG